MPIKSSQLPFAVSVLAGGLSTRMGRDKAQLRFGGRTLLGHVRQAALALEVPVRVIRRDLVPRCGPLGGIYTALQSTRAEAEMFLACDMPFVSGAWLLRLRAAVGARTTAAFTFTEAGAGFPLVLRASALPVVERLLREEQFSLQALARALQARRVWCPPARAGELRNLNTPEEWADAKKARPLRAAPK